jgi:threonine/homoserine/homoserine lactone efflux protein
VLGLSALLAASPVAYAVVHYLGAAYLIWMARHLLWRSLREHGSLPVAAAASPSSSVPERPRSGRGR